MSPTVEKTSAGTLVTVVSGREKVSAVPWPPSRGRARRPVTTVVSKRARRKREDERGSVGHGREDERAHTLVTASSSGCEKRERAALWPESSADANRRARHSRDRHAAEARR